MNATKPLFHALRVTYITSVVRGGASVKTAQTLARHSHPALTIGIYAKASIHDLSSPAPQPEAATLTATGTDGRILAAHWAGAEDGTRPDLSLAVVSDEWSTGSKAALSMGREPLEMSGDVAFSRPLTAERGGLSVALS